MSAPPTGPSTTRGITVLDPASLPRIRWRNGAGTTRLVGSGTRTRDAREAGWRVSIADIDGPSRFSLFPGTRRWSLVSSGAGLDLSIDGVEQTVPPGEVVAYSGESTVDARPCAGSDALVEVLNLMVTHGGGGSMRSRAVDGPVAWSRDVVAVLVLRGAVLSDGAVATAGQVLIPSDDSGATTATGAICVDMAVRP